MNKNSQIVKVDADATKSMLNHVGNEIIEGATDDNGKAEVAVRLSDIAWRVPAQDVVFARILWYVAKTIYLS